MTERDELDPLEAGNVRHSSDKLAILCSERPVAYILVRTLATLAVLLILTFALDLVALLMAWLASVPWLLYLLTDELAGEDERSALREITAGLPFDLIRIVALTLSLVALISTQLVATRGLPSGAAAMRATVVDGLPWPGRWRERARITRRLRPWAIAVTGVICSGVVVAALGWPASLGDYFYAAIVLGVVTAMVWFCAFLARILGLVLMNHLPSHVDVTSEELERAQRAVAEADAEDALRRWPKYPALRVTAAIRAFAIPPPPARRSERRRPAWWAGSETSVEALATELLVLALIEGESRGLVELADLHRRNPSVVGVLPRHQQPAGLAALIVGRHREGQVDGRRVAGKLSHLLDEVAGIDQYAQIIDAAIEDLAAYSIATRDNGVWALNRDRLVEAEKAVVSRSDTSHGSQQEIARLRHIIARRLRHKRTTDADPSLNPLKILAWIYIETNERHARRNYQLPAEAFRLPSGHQ